MKVIIINGPMGVGKTTVGKYIAEKYTGTAFIDGDWCLDIHPFVGNRETKIMAIDNILHMIDNYKKCSICKMVVLVWLMDEQWVYQKIVDGISDMELEVKSFTLTCDKNTLVNKLSVKKFPTEKVNLSFGLLLYYYPFLIAILRLQDFCAA